MADASTATKNLVGFAFNNPDLKNSYHAPKWGLLVSPDELRYDELFGNPLIAEADSFTFTDEQLMDYARLALAYCERQLNIDILPRLVRYTDRIGADGKEIQRPDINDADYISALRTEKQKEALYIREIGYPCRRTRGMNEIRIKLRRRPVSEILTAKFADPFLGSAIIDLMPFRILKPGLSGVVYFRPNRMVGLNWEFAWNAFLNAYASSMQDVFLIDYATGYKSCETVPDDLRHIIKKIAAVTLMATYGDGKMTSIAARSVSLNSVSESINTTMSATSAAFGARILQYQKEIKTWFATNTQKYSRTSIGFL